MEIKTPFLIIDEKRCRQNIGNMAAKAKANKVIFRPHFKTHQSKKAGEWFREEGVDKITVSSVSMAKYFIEHNWKDITIAFPFNILEIDDVNNISDNVVLNLLVESKETVEFLSENLNRKLNIFIKLDAGYNRTGIDISNFNSIKDLIELIIDSKNMEFTGLISHFGNTYKARSREEVIDIYNVSIEKLLIVKEKIFSITENFITSIGDTPSCSIINNFNGIDEIRPGNFVFYDLMQVKIGSCGYENVAVAVACPVVAKHKDRNEIVIYGGAIHFSKEFLNISSENKIYGQVVELEEDKIGNPIANQYVISLSQEHGIIKVDKNNFDKIKIGDVIGITPVHSCLAVNLMN